MGVFRMRTYQHGARSESKVCLTFDDGPNPYWTSKVLDLLDRYNVKASFFILGKYAERHPGIVKDIFDRGHTVGNHSYSHPKTPPGDFAKAEAVINNITGEPTRFIRPPHLNASLCRDYGPSNVQVINSDVFPQDYQSQAQNIIDFVEKNTKNGSIILLHDGSQREPELKTRPEQMFTALPRIIEILQNKEFKLVNLDELKLEQNGNQT